MAARDTLQVRQAALLLHGMPNDARERVLARLSAVEASRLQPLLRELAGLGLSPPAAPVPVSLPNGASARERAARLSAADVGRALLDCAPVTAAAVMRIAEWTWKEEAIAGFSELRRAEVRQHLRADAPSLPPAVAEALCERLCQAVNVLEPPHASSRAETPSLAPANRRLRRILQWTR